MNALKSIKLSLPVDEIRNEEAINSTQNKISFLLYRLSSILQDIYFLYHVQQFVSELIEYKNTKIKGLDLREITSLPESKNVMNMVRHFNHCQLKINCMLKAILICIRWKFTTPNQLASPLKILLSFRPLKCLLVAK